MWELNDIEICFMVFPKKRNLSMTNDSSRVQKWSMIKMLKDERQIKIIKIKEPIKGTI